MFVGEIDIGLKGTNSRGCNCVYEPGSPSPTWPKETGKLSRENRSAKAESIIHPSRILCQACAHRGMHRRIHAHTHTHTHTQTHTVMHPLWHMTIYFHLSNERQAEGMAHILHNFKSQTFFCTCIKLENQLTPQHHLPEALLHISGPSGTPGGHYIPCGKLFFLPTKLPLAYSRQKYTVNPQAWAKAPSLIGYT